MAGTDTPSSPLLSLRRALDEADAATVTMLLAQPERVVMYETGLDDIARLQDLLSTADGRLPVELAWQAAYAHHIRGLYEESISICGRADTSASSVFDLAQLRSVESSSAWGRGDADRCRALADEALELAKRSGDDTALAFAWVARGLTLALRGDRTANIAAYRRALAYAETAGDTAIQARIHCNLGSLANEECRYRDAVQHLVTAVQLTEQLGHHAIMALSHFNLAESRIGLGLVDEALVDLEATRELWQELDSPMVAIAAHGIGDTHRIRGNAAQAAAAYREAITLAERNDIAQTLVPALAGLARTTIDDDPAGATALVERALAQPAALGHVQTKLAAGWVALCLGDIAAAVAFGAEAEHEAGLRRNPRGIAEALELAALADPATAADGRLDEARAIWSDIESPIPLAVNQIVTARLASDHRAETAARARLGARRTRCGVSHRGTTQGHRQPHGSRRRDQDARYVHGSARRSPDHPGGLAVPQGT